jgi:hypothetical protein
MIIIMMADDGDDVNDNDYDDDNDQDVIDS